jgi:hypothetical protein
MEKFVEKHQLPVQKLNIDHKRQDRADDMGKERELNILNIISLFLV